MDLVGSGSYFVLEPCNLQGFLQQFCALSSAVWSTCFAHSLFLRVRKQYQRWIRHEERKARRTAAGPSALPADSISISESVPSGNDASTDDAFFSVEPPPSSASVAIARSFAPTVTVVPETEATTANVLAAPDTLAASGLQPAHRGHERDKSSHSQASKAARTEVQDQLLLCTYYDYLYHVCAWLIPLVFAAIPLFTDDYDLTGGW